jgi:hypothetical protein
MPVPKFACEASYAFVIRLAYGRWQWHKLLEVVWNERFGLIALKKGI